MLFSEFCGNSPAGTEEKTSVLKENTFMHFLIHSFLSGTHWLLQNKMINLLWFDHYENYYCKTWSFQNKRVQQKSQIFFQYPIIWLSLCFELKGWFLNLTKSSKTGYTEAEVRKSKVITFMLNQFQLPLKLSDTNFDIKADKWLKTFGSRFIYFPHFLPNGLQNPNPVWYQEPSLGGAEGCFTSWPLGGAAGAAENKNISEPGPGRKCVVDF